MHLNSRGDRCAGIGGTAVSVNGEVIARPAGGANWMDDDNVVYQVCDTDPSTGKERCIVEVYNVVTKTKRTLWNHGAFDVAGNGGVAAIWSGVVRFSDGRPDLPDAGLGVVGPDGAVAVKDSRQSSGPWSVIERDGSRWRLTDNDAIQINLLGQGRAVWLDTVGIRSRGGVPVPKLMTSNGIWWLKVLQIGSDWWALYQVGDGRLVFHPFDSFDGYVLSPVGSQTYRPDLCQLTNGKVRITWATREDEGPDVQVVIDFDMATARQPLLPSTPPPPPPPPSEDELNYKDYGSYLIQRWHELGIPAKMDEVTRRNSVSIEETQLLRRRSAALKSGRRLAGMLATKRLADLEEAYKAVQCPALVQIVGELYHLKGNKDAGLSTKNGGNNWTLIDGRKVATDIVAVKPTDDGGKVVPGNFIIVDVLVSGGTADTRPGWSILGENTDSSRPWAEPPTPDGSIPDEPDPPTGDTHRYVGGGNDTGTCDQCGRPKLDAVHRVPEGKVKGHTPWLGEDGKGDCDLCFQPVGAAIHQKDEPQEPDVPTTYHPFVGSATAKFCEECGQGRTAAIHQKPADPEPGNGGSVDTDRIVEAIEKASVAEIAAINQLRTDVVKAVKDAGKLLPGILGGLAKSPVKKSGRSK